MLVAKYHVTTADRLPEIATEGLSPGQRSAIGGPIYDSHRKLGVFLTEAAGVNFWDERAEAFIVDNFDDYDKKGITPIVLRAAVDPSALKPDEIGSTDSRKEASIHAGVIPPDKLEVWNGRKWESIETAKLDLSTSFDEEGYLDGHCPLRAPDFLQLPPHLTPQASDKPDTSLDPVRLKPERPSAKEIGPTLR